MNTASLELSKELYELSGWHDTNGYLYEGKSKSTIFYEYTKSTKWWYEDINATPAYPLGYLLRKLPPLYRDIRWKDSIDTMGRGWYQCHDQKADTPEDCAAKLAIELFKQEILTKEGA